MEQQPLFVDFTEAANDTPAPPKKKARKAAKKGAAKKKAAPRRGPDGRFLPSGGRGRTAKPRAARRSTTTTAKPRARSTSSGRATRANRLTITLSVARPRAQRRRAR